MSCLEMQIRRKKERKICDWNGKPDGDGRMGVFDDVYFYFIYIGRQHSWVMFFYSFKYTLYMYDDKAVHECTFCT